VTEQRLHCRRARETLSAALDGEASETEVAAVVQHLRLCLGCRDFLAGVVRTTRALRAGRTAVRRKPIQEQLMTVRAEPGGRFWRRGTDVMF
jgi:predicted anti-sigma-YlaC factor YlaD